MSKEFLKQYVEDAKRTESRLENLNLNKEAVGSLLCMYIHITEILDGLKKSLYYGKNDKFERELDSRLTAIKQLATTALTPTNSCNYKVIKKDLIENIDPRVFHAILGIMTESGELADIILNLLNDPNSQIDPIHVQEELGDLSGWYTAIAHDALNLDMTETLSKNIRKLKVRFPEKFTENNAEVRDLDAERTELEK